MKIVNGFVWKIVEEKQAMQILALDVLSIYALRNDDTEYLITDFYELLSAVKKGYLLGIEVGKLTNN